MNLFFLLGNGMFIFVFGKALYFKAVLLISRVGAWITLQLKWVYGREAFAVSVKLRAK